MRPEQHFGDASSLHEPWLKTRWVEQKTEHAPVVPRQCTASQAKSMVCLAKRGILYLGAATFIGLGLGHAKVIRLGSIATLCDSGDVCLETCANVSGQLQRQEGTNMCSKSSDQLLYVIFGGEFHSRWEALVQRP